MKYTNKCVIYARVSTIDKQDYQRQIDELKDYARLKNLNVAKVFGENISGVIGHQKRYEFVKMLEYIKENDIHHVLVSELSRLGRKMRDTIEILNNFTEDEICVHIFKNGFKTLEDDFKENKFTTLIINILASFADIERDTITERSKSGLRFHAKNRGSGGGIIKPFGFKTVNKKLEIDENEANIVKLIFSKYIEGYGSHQIANMLNDSGIKTKYNKIFDPEKFIKSKKGRIKKAKSFVWRSTTIINMLKNSIYFGERKYKNEIFTVDPIIDKETFNRAKIVRENKYNKVNNSTRYENIFSGVIKCPLCKSTYYMHKRADNRDNAYKCLSKRLPDVNCNNISVNIDKLNNATYILLNQHFSLARSLDSLKTKYQKLKDEKDILNIELRQLYVEIQSELTKQKNLVKSNISMEIDSLVFTELNNEIKSDIKRLHEKINNKEKQIHTIERLQSVSISAKEKRLEDANVFKKYIRDYIEYIHVYDATKLVNSGMIGSLFKTKNETICLIEVKSNLIDDHIFFLLGRYSNIVINLNLSNLDYFEKKIPYMEDDDYTVYNIPTDIKI